MELAGASRHLLEVKNLETEFHTDYGVVRAVDGVDLHIDEGETVGLVGESGCGKSVAALSIVRLVPDPPGRIVGGQVLFEGTDLLQLDVREMRHVRGPGIGIIFQGAIDIAESSAVDRASDRGAVAGAFRHDATAGVVSGGRASRPCGNTGSVGSDARLSAHDERRAASAHHDRHRTELQPATVDRG